VANVGGGDMITVIVVAICQLYNVALNVSYNHELFSYYHRDRRICAISEFLFEVARYVEILHICRLDTGGHKKQMSSILADQ
jgi:hypothetical protein